MTIYFIGDIQGCYSELDTLLSEVAFSSRDDQLYVAGDLVARGPNSLETLQLLKSLNNNVHIVLGNHDLHLLAVYHQIKKIKQQDKLSSLLLAKDCEELLFWLAQQPLIQKLPNEDTYLSHAGLSPQWSIEQALINAQDAHEKLTSSDHLFWLAQMYGNQPNYWSDSHNEIDKFRYTINSLTRMRFCFSNGNLDFNCKSSISQAPQNLIPWFEFNHIAQNTNWLFGHWASLMGNSNKKNIFALDTGCVWGNHLTLLRWHDKKLFIAKAK